jgi:hypothetical protein
MRGTDGDEPHMPEHHDKRLSATFEVQVRIGSDWQIIHACEDRDEAVLEAVALIGHYDDKAPIRVLGELHDTLTNTTHPRVIWSHKPAPKPAPAAIYEQRREVRVKNARDRGALGRREGNWGVVAVVVIGFLLLVLYVGLNVDMYNVRH